MPSWTKVRVAGPLAPYAPGFGRELRGCGYTDLSTAEQLRLMSHLSRWMTREGLDALGGEQIAAYCAARKADGYVAKPFQGGRIIELVRSRMAVAKETISVLIAEDSGGIRSILRRAFATLPHRFQLREASDGQQAIDMFETRPADLVFLDIHMPNNSGIEALEHIRRLAPDVWIIMCTSDASADSINDAKAFRANDFLLKPFTPTQFSQMVQRFFDRRR